MDNSATVDRKPSARVPDAGRGSTRPRRQRSRVTTGKELIPGRCKDIIAEHVADKGGEDCCSAAEKSIIRRASVLTTELEMIERKFALAQRAGKGTDLATLETYTRVANGMRRLLEAIGLQRRPRDIGPSLADVMLEGDQS